MFKKLKQKIDEQSPQRNDQSPQQAKKGEPQSLAQKLQQRVSSADTVFWGSSIPEQPPHSSSRESLVHSPSWESLSSLGQNEVLGSPTFDPPSDIESEVEDVPGSAEGLSKEHLLNCLHRMEKRLTDYKGKYSEMVIAYRSIQRDKEKMQVVLSQSQDKALRRIGELKEELQMDQEAKKHLQAEFDSSLEEKDQIISVLQTQVALMKKRFKSSSGALDLPDEEASKTTYDPEIISDLQPHLDSPENNAGGSYEPGSTVVLQKQVWGQDALLERCEKLVGTSKEESSRLSNENEALQEQLQERLQELEKMKELHTTEKTKLITQLRDAKNLIEQLEQDKGMVIAQTKRQMHDTLEMKEEEILQLRSRIQQTLAEKEELQEQREKAEKAASEELECALIVGQRSEEGRRELQARMEEQLKTMQDCDEERRNLEQELIRVKQEMENIQKRNLELDSCLAEYSQKEASQSDFLSKEIEEQTRKFEAEIAAIEEKCTQEMERLTMELTDSLNQQHAAAVFILQQQHSIEIEAVKKANETQLHAHVEEMNQKMLAELNAKQTEMEGLSSMLIEVRKSKQQLEEKLADMEAATDSVKQELQVRLSEEEAIYHAKFADINNQHKETLEQVKTLNEELNHVKTTLQEKNKELEEHVVNRRMLEENAKKTQLNVKAQFKEIEDLRHITQTQNEDLSKSKTQMSFLKNELKQSKVRLKDLENHLEESRKECQHKALSLEQKANENEELHQRVKQAMNDLSEKENALEEMCKTIHDQRMWFKTQLEKVKCLYERNGECLIKELDGKLKSQEVVIEKVKRKTEEMQGNLTKKLKEHEVNSKLEEAKKEMEFEQKDQQIYLKALELAQESTHKNLQENEQKLKEMSQQLLISREDKELLVQKVKDLGEEVAMRETTAQKLQVELNHAVVKLEQKSEEEKMLKKEVEFVENNLNKALNEKTLLQEQLHNSEESSGQRLLALSKELEETQEKLNALEICSESEKAAQLQNNENLLQMQIGAINRELEQHCQGVQAVVNHFSDDICSKVDAKISGLQNRLLSNQKKAFCLKNVIFTKNDQICTLQKELQETVKESRNLKCSLDDVALLLNVYSENLKTVTSEKESLQKRAEDHSQVLSIEIPHREKLGHESRNISEKPKTDVLHVSNLESFVNDLKAQLATSLAESTEAISLLKRQHSQEKQSLRCFTEETVKKGEKEKKLADEQVDMLRNQLSEVKTQTESTILALQNKIEDMEGQIADKDKALQRLATSIDGQQSEREQLSSLTIEIDNCTRRINELENQLDLQNKEREHLVAELQHHRSEKTVFIQQLQQAREECSLKSDLYHKADNKMRSLQADIKKANQEMEFQQREFQKEHADILKAKEDALKAAECSTGKLSDLKKKAEHKIGLIRKHLTSQIEEKERTIRDLQIQLKDISQRQNEDRTKLSEHNERLEGENAFAILKDARQETLTCLCDNEQTISRIADLKTDPNQSPEEYTSHDTESVAEPNTVHNETSEKYTSHKTERTCPKAELSCLGFQDETNTREMTAIKGNENDIKQAISLLEVQPISAGVIKGRTANENQEDWESEKDRLVKEYEMKLTELSRRLEDKTKRLKDQENIRNELCDPDDGRCTDGSEEVKFADVDSKRQKIHKDYVQLQKELLSLRKEHEKDLEYLRKEIMEENEKKQKLEVEDMEIKHNFALKQLMREYNAQMSLKEKELEESIKEAFEKARCVEAELMESHREETSQMKKIIAQKDEELNRTVQRYEQVLQSREEEMSNRVCEIKKELEDLQQRSRNSSQGLEEIQTQLAKKTTLLSEARLREQESQDRIHELEDKIQTTYKNLVVTHLGSKNREPSYYSSDLTEFEYLRKVMFEYMMGRETKTMAKVITSMLKFPADQTQKVLEREDSRVMPWLR